MKLNNENIFISANPLQILMSVSIVRQLGIAERSLLIIHGGFTGAKDVAENFSADDFVLGGLEVIYLNSRKAALDFAAKIRPCRIFIDGDVGFRNFKNLLFLKLPNRKLEICVFEEGIGTYRNDLYSGPKRKLFKSVGIGVNLGGCVLTTYVYVTNPSLYQAIFPECSKKICPINDEPSKILSAYPSAWSRVFSYSSVKKTYSDECNIYLSNWHFRIDPLERFLSTKGDHYIKLHPRCNDNVSIQGVVVLETPAPAEMIISDLSKKYDFVRVFHHGSSVAQYFSESNVIFIRL